MGPPILLVKAGATHADVAARFGDYDAWFRRGLPDGERRCTVVRPYEGDPLPAASNFGGIVVSGSPASVRDEAPWMAALARWALDAAAAGVPVLGVCFGHQLLGEALGGRVEKNPLGREAGTVEVELTPEGAADPLFEGLPRTLVVQATHQDVLVRAPTHPGVTRLAGNGNTPWQAFAHGLVRAVQFHPELDPEALGVLNRTRGLDAPLSASDHGPRLLSRWDEVFVRRSA